LLKRKYVYVLTINGNKCIDKISDVTVLLQKQDHDQSVKKGNDTDSVRRINMYITITMSASVLHLWAANIVAARRIELLQSTQSSYCFMFLYIKVLHAIDCVKINTVALNV